MNEENNNSNPGKIKQIVSKIRERVRKLFARIGSDPKKDWKVFLIVISVLLVLLSVFQVSLFYSAHEQMTSNTVPGDSGVKTIDKESLSSALKQFDSKKDEYQQFISNPPNFQEPSF